MKNQKMIIAAVVAVLITGILAGGITYGVLSARFSRESDSLSKRLAALEKTLNKKPTAQEAAPSITPDAAKAEEAKYGDWLTYTNAATGFTLRYPPDWTYEDSDETVDGKPVQSVTFISPGTEYYVAFGLRAKGSDALLSARTGVGQGDLKDNGSVTVLGAKVKKTEHIYKGKIKTIFYAGAGGMFEADGFQGSAELSIVDSGDYEAYDLAGLPEGITADKIVTSLKIIK